MGTGTPPDNTPNIGAGPGGSGTAADEADPFPCCSMSRGYDYYHSGEVRSISSPRANEVGLLGSGVSSSLGWSEVSCDESSSSSVIGVAVGVLGVFGF